MLKIKEYLSEWAISSGAPDLKVFLVNLVVTLVLGSALALLRARFGKDNRRTGLLLPLAICTQFIVVIVKDSLALSLVMLAMLALLRLRVPFRRMGDPLSVFFALGIGIATGANQPLLAAIAFAFVTVILLMQTLLSGQSPFQSGNMNILMKGKISDPEKAGEILKSHFSSVTFLSFDANSRETCLSYRIRMDKPEQIGKAKEALLTWEPSISIQILSQETEAE